MNIPEISLRDYFAAQTLPALAALHATEKGPDAKRSWQPEAIARWAYQIADAMIAEKDNS